MLLHINILCEYYHRMIFIMVIHEHQKKDRKPHKSTENWTTPYIWENTEKTHSRKRMTQAYILGTASNNHTKTWTLNEHQRGMINAESIWTDSNRTDSKMDQNRHYQTNNIIWLKAHLPDDGMSTMWDIPTKAIYNIEHFMS